MRASVHTCVRACTLVQVCVCVFGYCFVSANGLLVDVCHLSVLLFAYACMLTAFKTLVVKLGE